MGLGLAVVYRIVKQSGGYIAVESAPGQGARFTVYLPGVSPGEEAPGRAVSRGWVGGGAPGVRRCGVGLLDQPATVIEIVRERVVAGRTATGRGGR